LALGLNAAGGNIGVSTVQLLVPIVITIGGGIHLHYAGVMWLPLILVATIGAFLFMDNLATAKSNFKDQVAVARHKHTWIMSFLYVGTFGSFVGYSAGFPLLLKTQFPSLSMNLAFLGPLVGSLARPLGGWLADRLGGSRVTFWNFVAMALFTACAIGLRHDLASFLLAFLALFVTTGLGNGSTFRMIPAIFRKLNTDPRKARRESAAVIGVSSAIGALGGFFIPRALGASIKATGAASTALAVFFTGYLICLAVTWWYYRRSSFLVKTVPSLAEANA
jgi:NNP family nitrate/nitrite transporter-like MFS transporter